MADARQPDLFPELTKATMPRRPRPPKLYPAARKRRQIVERMTLKGRLVREIAAAANCTITHVLRIRQELRAAGRIPETERSIDPPRYR